MDLSTIGFRPMTEADLPAVDAIEQAVQSARKILEQSGAEYAAQGAASSDP